MRFGILFKIVTIIAGFCVGISAGVGLAVINLSVGFGYWLSVLWGVVGGVSLFAYIFFTELMINNAREKREG